MRRGRRENGPVYPDEVIADVRAKLGWTAVPEPERSPAEVLPPEVADDPVMTRRLLRSL